MKKKLKFLIIPVSLIAWIGEFVVGGIISAITEFFTTMGLEKWWKKKD